MKKSAPFQRKRIAIIISSLCSGLAFSVQAEEPKVSTYETVEVWGTQINNDS